MNDARKLLRLLKEGTRDNDKEYAVTCRDIDGTLRKLLEYIMRNGNGGHSFSIIVDPGDEREEKFFWDGDGNDHIYDVIEKGD